MIAGPAPGPAVKVTLVPAQIVVALADNVGVGNALTAIVMFELVAVQPDAVATTVTTSLLTNVVVEYVVPAPLCFETPLTWKS
jgi:F0F1-type ATP synthase membrane subunit c/vacuolar-type H+-ATPase subunit K